MEVPPDEAATQSQMIVLLSAVILFAVFVLRVPVAEADDDWPIEPTEEDPELWKPHPPTEECPICLVPLPLRKDQTNYLSCCGKVVCKACDAETDRALHIANDKRKKKKLPPMEALCQFCREPIHGYNSALINRYEQRVDKGDPEAMMNLAEYYKTGEFGLRRNKAKSVMLVRRAADLGFPTALAQLGEWLLYGERGLKQDEEKGRRYLEDAAKKGDVNARIILGELEEEDQDDDLATEHFELATAAGCKLEVFHDLATKHYRLAAAAGDENSMKRLWEYFSSGQLCKAELEETLRAHHEACDNMQSLERERFAAASEALEGNDGELKLLYETYYHGTMNAKLLKRGLAIHRALYK